MKKTILCIIGIFMLTSMSLADIVSTNRAMDVAQKFYQHFNPVQPTVAKKRIDMSVPPIKTIYTEKYNNLDTFYIISMTEGGFVLVSAEDVIVPVLGYSFDNDIDEQTMSPAARQWFDYYSFQIAYAIAQGLTSTQNQDEWQSIENNDFSSGEPVPAMPPLIATQWNQKSPGYNYFAPDNTYTGCVATAMAQIMKYFNYPFMGTGDHQYTHDDYGALYADFNTQYQWTLMPDSLSTSSTAEEITAVALLLYHCGVSVDMDYGLNGSGASTYAVAQALPQYFYYADTAVEKAKSDYTEEQWTHMLIEEIDNYRPVLYRGEPNDADVGHAFVCDGYQGTQYFHFNWGWGGAYDGYFRLSALTPGTSDFTYEQGAIFGIQPEKQYERVSIVLDDFEETFPSTGWSQAVVSPGSPSPEWTHVSTGSNPSCTPIDGNFMIQFNSNTTPNAAEARLLLPVIDLSNLDYPRLTFMMYHEDSNSSLTSEGITVQISEDGVNWTDIQFYPRYIIDTGWQTYRIDLTYYTGKTVYVAFLGQSANGSNIYLDHIEINYAGATSGMILETLVSYAGASISFTDNSFQASTYAWDFGDTTTATSQNVTHVYTNPGIYTVVHSVDSGMSSVTQNIHILPVIIPSYLPEHGGNFENNSLHFGTKLLAGSINLWEPGTPSNTISDTASGTNVWKTDLDSNIQQDNYTCALYTPDFDLSATGSYYVSFKYRMEIAYSNCPGAAWMEYSTDQGKTWQRLGDESGNPEGTQNWYNKSSHNIAPDGICWWHERTEYTHAIYNMTEHLGESHMAFRFVYKVESAWETDSFEIDGFAIDDFSLEYEAPTANFTMDREFSYVGKNIEFTDTSTFPTNWSWDFGDSTTSINQNPNHAYSSPGDYTITLSINSDASQTSKCITILPVITPSYLPEDGGDFESNPQHFLTNIIDGDINLWERGIPLNEISDTASGINVWKTDLDSDIQKANYTCVLNTPAFDLSAIGSYYLKFKYRMQIMASNCPGAAWIEYSSDQGDTWQRLGANTGNPDNTENWYNQNEHDVAPDGICWWHTKTTYTQAIYNLTSFTGESSICFRFVYKVDGNWAGGYDIDGFAIDDFELEYIPPKADFQTTVSTYYVGIPVQFTDQSTFPISWLWDVEGAAAISQNVTHTFTEPGSYSVTLSINNNASSITKQIIVLPVLKPSYSTDDGGDFESNTLHFWSDVTNGDVNLWEHGTPSNTISDTASGTNVWKTDLDNNIQKATYTCVLNTPAFNLSRPGNYFLKLKFRMQTVYGNGPAGAWIEYSTDYGNTWQRLGSASGNPTDTVNWYNISDHNYAPDGICWCATIPNYAEATYNLSEFSGTSTMSFRMVYMVNENFPAESYHIDGWAIDDFEIEHQTNAPTIHTPIPDQTINENDSFTPITLDNYVTDSNHQLSELTWTTSGDNHLTITISNRIASITVSTIDWSGTETVSFTVTDPDGMTDTEVVVFTVVENVPVIDLESFPIGQLGLGEPSIIFANAIKEAMFYLESDETTVVELDDQGWLTRYPEGVPFVWYSLSWTDARDDQTDLGYYGVWVLTWEGEGDIVLNNDNRSQEILLHDTGAKRMVVKIPPGTFPLVEITSINTEDYIKNIKLWPPTSPGAGFDLTVTDALGPGEITDSLEPSPGDPDPVFHPLRLEHHQQANFGVLRFMDWLHINGEDTISAGDWEDRRPRDYATQASSTIFNHSTRVSRPVDNFKSNSGIAYEYLIELCNKLDKDLWIQTPHDVSEAYIRELARLIAGHSGHMGLEPGLKVWVELSNEIWNPVLYYIQQVEYSREIAAQHFGVTIDEIETLGERHGWGSGHIQGEFLRIFADEWGLLGMPAQNLITVASGFLHGTDPYNTAVIDAVREVAPNHPKAFAVTHYFGAVAEQLLDIGYDSNGDAPIAVYEKAFLRIEQDLFSATKPAIEANVALCQSKGNISLVAYEGGQHLAAPIWLQDQDDYIAFLNNVNRHSLMAETYRLMYAVWTAAGAMTASQFVDIFPATPWGAWGAKEYIRQPVADAPKWKSFIEWEALQKNVRKLNNPINNAPQITTDSNLPVAEVQTFYDTTITAVGGDGNYSFLFFNELPDGLAFTSTNSGEGRISGIPQESGFFRLILRVLDQDNDPAYAYFYLRVNARHTSINAIVHFNGANVVVPEGEDHVNLLRQITIDGDTASLTFSMANGDHFYNLTPTSNLNMYGGFRVVTSGDGETSIWCRLDEGNPGYFGVQPGANGESPWVFDAILVWRKDQFIHGASTQQLAFGNSPQTAMLRINLQSLIPDSSEVRFVIQDETTWYISEAKYDRTISDAFELNDFNNNAAPDKRWAIFSPAQDAFAIPAPEDLTFSAHEFTDVNAVGIAYKGERFGWHWDFSFDEFLVLAQMTDITVTEIPDQTISESNSFTPIMLDDYVKSDYPANELIWTATGQTALSITISDGVATVIVPNQWTGTETIVFTATDPDGLTDSHEVQFIIDPLNPPVITGLPLIIQIQKPHPEWNGHITVTFTKTDENGQSTDISEEFFADINDGSYTPVNLDDFLANFESYSEINWTVTGQNDLTITMDSTNHVNIQVPESDWARHETITFTTSDTNGLTNFEKSHVTPVDDILEDSDFTLIIEGSD